MQYIEEFLIARKLEGLSEGSLDQYKRELNLFYNFVNKSTLTVTTIELRKYFLQFSHLAQRTVNRKISTLKAYYTWLTQEEYVVINPMLKIKTPKEPATLPKNLNKEEVELLRWHPKPIRNQAIIELLLSSGMRISELTSLNRNDLDMTNREIRIIGKGSKERIVFFSQIAKFCLLNYFTTRKDKNDALFINKYGERLSTRSIEMQIKKYAKDAGIINKVTPHVLRHTLGSTLYEQGADIDFIARILGHESTDTTRRYTYINSQTMSKMYNKFMIS